MFSCLNKYKQLFIVISILSFLAFSNIRALTNHIQDAQKTPPTAIKKVSSPNKVSLTFDDGPSPLTTPELLAILQSKNVKATFFILGKNAQTYPELLQQISLAGHEIGNHGYSHARLARLSDDDIEAELLRTDAIIVNITGQKARFVRPPDNSYNNNVVNFVHQLGYTFILWSIDTRDWTNASEGNIMNKIAKVQAGDIILFHDGVVPSKTVAALPLVIDTLHEKGFELVTIGELLQ